MERAGVKGNRPESAMTIHPESVFVMAGLVPAIHVFLS
jgi:hypothetical protein